jgi:aryl-alcohol dehydrogenase-like predicted oxidoreductase
MKIKQLGTSDLQVSEICLGTMTFGVQNTVEDARQQLDYATSRGINFFDAAETYPVPPSAETQGRTEEYLGHWLADQQRDRFIVATKIAGPAPDRLTWLRGRGGQHRVDRENIIEAVEMSLKRLKTNYIDLFQIHWPDRYVPIFGGPDFDISQERDSVPIREQLEALGDLIRAGKIRYVGVSNETSWGVAEFCRLAREHDLPMIASIQNGFSLVNRVFHATLAEMCHGHNVSLMAYSVLAFGHLTGKYIRGTASSDARLSRFPEFGFRYTRATLPDAIRAYVEIAEQNDLSPAQMAIAWVRSRWFVASTIIGATTLEQLEQNIDSIDIELSDEVLEAIEEVHLRNPSPAP